MYVPLLYKKELFGHLGALGNDESVNKHVKASMAAAWYNSTREDQVQSAVNCLIRIVGHGTEC